MGVDHRVDRGHVPLGRNVFCPPYFLGSTNTYYVLDLLNNDCFSTPTKHNIAQ